MDDKEEILEMIQAYLSILMACKNEEMDNSVRLEYDQHIKAAEILSSELNGQDNLYNYLPQYFESERRAFGWSFLPGINGEKAEAAFWNLKKQYNLDPNPSRLTNYQLSGMTVNERLVVCGMLEEFDKAKKQDKRRAAYILKELFVDEDSINKILK
jgi:hypothetical protein